MDWRQNKTKHPHEEGKLGQSLLSYRNFLEVSGSPLMRHLWDLTSTGPLCTFQVAHGSTVIFGLCIGSALREPPAAGKWPAALGPRLFTRAWSFGGPECRWLGQGRGQSWLSAYARMCPADAASVSLALVPEPCRSKPGHPWRLLEDAPGCHGPPHSRTELLIPREPHFLGSQTPFWAWLGLGGMGDTQG